MERPACLEEVAMRASILSTSIVRDGREDVDRSRRYHPRRSSNEGERKVMCGGRGRCCPLHVKFSEAQAGREHLTEQDGDEHLLRLIRRATKMLRVRFSEA